MTEKPYPLAAKHPTNAADIFVQMVLAVRAGKAMIPRSANDKEYFAQDWFAERLDDGGFHHQLQGRNSYPDFWVTGDAGTEGFEIKSLGFDGRPARKDIDFNSTIPSGGKAGTDVFLVFFLYTGNGANPRPVHSISIAHGDLINADRDLADEHLNVAVKDFGSYGDGFIRNRKMYVFPHPITIDPSSLGRCRLIVPEDWALDDPRLIKVGTLTRAFTPESVESYTIRLRGRGQAAVTKVRSPDQGRVQRFSVFEVRADL